MFDSVGAFTKLFTPVDGGYLFHPSRKSGGKLVTAEEHDRLVASWEQIAGRAGIWKTVGVVVLILVLWTFLSEGLSLTEWADTVVIASLVLAISAWMLWASFAPRRLVRDRPAVTAPRPLSEARREARATLNWPFVIFALLLSGATFLGTVTTTERTLSTWAWLVGSGLMLGVYLWIGFQKLFDARR